MLRKFAGILLATALIAGPAVAAQPNNAGSTATHNHRHAVYKHAKLGKSAKLVHARKHIHKHVAHGKTHTMKQARHFKPTPTHKSQLAKSHPGKTAKITKS